MSCLLEPSVAIRLPGVCSCSSPGRGMAVATEVWCCCRF